MNRTPQADRLHITLYGKRNSGKSSLINALCGQQIALVSDVAGTTTDPVNRAIEINPLGACLLTDTAGFDDNQALLGDMRVARTEATLAQTDIALLLCQDIDDEECAWFKKLQEHRIPTVLVLNKIDEESTSVEEMSERIKAVMGEYPVAVSARQNKGMPHIVNAILQKLPADYHAQTITGELVKEGDVVLLVMPQDIQAPKGRLILPQVQTMRELLDKQCVVMSCTTSRLAQTLQTLRQPPKLIITDSQAFATVYAQKPEESLLTSFSVLMAAYKGDMDYFIKSAQAIGRLTEASKVLIAEACTHVPMTEDIGRVKIPRMLRKRVGEDLRIDWVSGKDFPEDLSSYNLVIHCGACMFNRKLVLSRVAQAKAQGAPMTNYGVTIAYMTDILDKVCYPDKK